MVAAFAGQRLDAATKHSASLSGVTPPKPDTRAVESAIAYLKRHGCPNPQRGEGSELFAPKDGLKTPDIVVGHFRGEVDPDTFFVDVVSPSGDQVTNERAGAPDASRFFMKEVEEKPDVWRTLADIPDDLGRPLVGSVLRKADKYSAARRGSPLLGVVAYFNEQGAGKQILTMVTYLKAIHEELGQVSDKLVGELIVNRTSTMLVQVVSWDVPLGFLLQLVEDRGQTRGALVVNQHARLTPHVDHEVVSWMAKL